MAIQAWRRRTAAHLQILAPPTRISSQRRQVSIVSLIRFLLSTELAIEGPEIRI
jgi:hypothetical protein